MDDEDDLLLQAVAILDTEPHTISAETTNPNSTISTETTNPISTPLIANNSNPGK